MEIDNKSYKYPLSEPELSKSAISLVSKTIQSNTLAIRGPELNEFEKALNSFVETKGFLGVNSGTSAIHIALILAGVKPGDLVICPTLTFIASAAPIVYLGAKPVFLDCNPDSWNLDPTLLEQCLHRLKKQHKKPAAVIVVDLYGVPAEKLKISRLCSEFNIPLIEDAAESLGSEIGGLKSGILGDFGIFSFNGNKIITTAGGGALWCRNPDLREKAARLINHSREDLSYYEHLEIGYNYRLSNLQAALGLSQIEFLEKKINKKRLINSWYKKHLDNNKFYFQKKPKNSKSNNWLTVTAIKSPVPEVQEIIDKARSEGIEMRHLWKPLHLQPVFQNNTYYGSTFAVQLFNRGLCLPSGSKLTEDNVKEISDFLNRSV